MKREKEGLEEEGDRNKGGVLYLLAWWGVYIQKWFYFRLFLLLFC